jgi:HEAT repeat protein
VLPSLVSPLSSASLIEIVLTSARTAVDADYTQRLDLLEKAAQTARMLCARLTRRDAREARSVLLAVLEMQIVGGCVAACGCGASYVRAVAIEAKCAVLGTWRLLDPDAAIEFAPSLVAQLIAPSSRRIALATIELLGRSPAACRVHLASVITSLAHPRWQVAEAAARGLGRLGIDVDRRVRVALTRALGHEQWQVRRAAATALGAATGGAHARLLEAALRDDNSVVRNAARKAIGENAAAFPRSAEN